jgi:lactate dehydrogenase-like 2-hydroxyacid dehydrogenase
VALMMALSKRLHQIGGRVSDERLAAGGFSPAPFDTRHSPGANWGRVSGLRTLNGSRLGLVGFGEIGREVARLGRGLGMEVAYHQRTRLNPDEEASLGVRYLSLDDLMSDSDIISIHVPKEVESLIDARALSMVKAGALLINVARAASVERGALLAALGDGRLGGAGMDVHYREPVPPDDAFLSLDNVILTPHLAGASRHNGLQDMSDMLAGLGRALAEAGR